MSDEVYRRLREFLDKLSLGFPETPTGVEIKLLKKMYSPEEAELTMKLKTEPEEVSAIAKRIGMDEKQLEEKLEEAARKGLIYRVRSGEKRLYHAIHFLAGGVYEFQMKRLDKEFCELLEEYDPHFLDVIFSVETNQTRVLPVESAVGKGKGVAPYNQVRELVKKQEIISVQECICRERQEILGNKCNNNPREVCIGLGDYGQFYIDNNFGRQITQEECLKILDKAEEAGLVLQPDNSENVQWICCCCSCCCPTLKIAQSVPRPQDVMKPYYEAKIDPEECTACGDCVGRCPMDAIQEGDTVCEVIDGRCIGCGVCVSSCTVEAISMEPRPGMEAPPKDMADQLKRIATERGLA